MAWVDSTDLRAPEEEAAVGLGPVAQAVSARKFDEVVLLSNFSKAPVEAYARWISGLSSCHVRVERCNLSGPTEFGEIYTAAVGVVQETLRRHGPAVDLTFHLSPGTPAMAAVWIILAKTRFPSELIESSREHGVRTASVPFDISVDFLPDLLRRPDQELERLTVGLPPEEPEFEQIVRRGQAMKRVILRARRVTVRSVPVLIESETGTGKELLARAIHRAGPRRERPFVAVNCVAIPTDLVESELFGHEKGAFTGAAASRKGHFVRAAIWTPEPTLKAEDNRDALLPLGGTEEDRIVGRPLGEGIDLTGLLATVARHYLERALDEAAGNKTRAAKLVGLPSYQALTNWMKRYGVTA